MDNLATITPIKSKPFFKALFVNTIWVNISGLLRYFLVVGPMLTAAYPDNPDIAPVSLPILASWGLWTVGFMITTTGFYWMYFDRYGVNKKGIILAGLWITIAIIGLLWLGIINMGLAPLSLLIAAGPLALFEQIISAYIVSKFARRS